MSHWDRIELPLDEAERKSSPPEAGLDSCPPVAIADASTTRRCLHVTRTLLPLLASRNGRELIVVGVARISTINQDELSLEDQEALYRSWLEAHTELPFRLIMIASQGSGECLDRKESAQLMELVEGGTIDLVITEDLARIFRRVHAHIFCELCEDFDTRLIAINDNVDTARDDWRMHSFFAVFKHESGNRDTAKRIRRSLRNRFNNGGVVQTLPYGYIKPPGAKSDQDVKKAPEAEPIYEEWFSRLERDESYAEVADWLHQKGVPRGPGCRAKRWTGPMVARITHNPILKGVRERNKKMSKRVNVTGRHKSIDAPPEELLQRACPHLAFFEPGRYDHLIHKLAVKNARFSAGRKGKGDPRKDRPKKRTRFPGQSIDCGICGRQYVFGGHGQIDHLMCNGARDYACWNGATVDGSLATAVISKAVFSEIEALAGFDSAFLAQVNAEAQKLDKAREAQLHDLGSKLAKVNRQIGNVVEFKRDGDSSPSIRADLGALERERIQLQYQHAEALRTPTTGIVIPSIDELKQLARESFEGLASNSFEFASVMRRLIARITVFPYRLVDGGPIVLRAKFQLDLANLTTDNRLQQALQQPLERTIRVDLFEKPQRVVHREELLVRRQTMTEREAAHALGITVAAAQRAAALDRMMTSMGLTDGYLRILAPPTDSGRVRRFLHERYRFDPLPGFPINPF